jgi:predicted DNA-binding helix-hairpin-helix protein
MPGWTRTLIFGGAMQLADRVSINLEAPNASRLTPLAPHKDFENELLADLGWMEDLRKASPGPAGWRPAPRIRRCAAAIRLELGDDQAPVPRRPDPYLLFG